MHFNSILKQWLLFTLGMGVSFTGISSPTYPAAYTTHSNLSCLGCSVSNAGNAINNNNNDFATIAIPLGILSQTSLELEFAASIPAGSHFSLILEDPLNLVVTNVDYDLLLNHTAVTHTGWSITDEAGSGSKKLLSTFTTAASNKVRISVTGLLTSIKNLRVYSAYFNPVALPVHFINFVAKQGASGVELAWQTAHEADIHSFQVLRSKDLQGWEKLGTLAGKGINGKISTYRFTDTQPVEGLSYYQIKQVAIQGRDTYSRFCSIHFVAQVKKTLSVYPNPASREESLQIRLEGGDEEELYQIKMYTMQGVCVWKKDHVLISDPFSIADLKGLSNGSYLLFIQSSRDQMVKQIEIR